MAVAIILTLIGLTIPFQGIRGQSNLSSNGATQNNMNQGYSTNTAKSADLTQNSGNLMSNFNSQLQPNSPQAPSLTMPSLFSMQSQPNIQQLMSQQPVAFQQPYQQMNSGQQYLQQSLLPSTSMIQQTPGLQQTNAFVPAFNQFSYSQQLPMSGHLVNIPSLSISNPASAIVSAYPSNCACTQTGFIPNTGNTYLPLSSVPITERPQVVTSYSLPYASVISSPSSFSNNAVLPYQNQVIGLLNNPLEDKLVMDEQNALDSDNINDLLLSLLQTPKYSSKMMPFPYSPMQGLKGNKSSQLKSLLPVIINLLKEKRERCSCDNSNSCKCKRRHKKGSEPQITGYSKRKDYDSLREGLFKNNSEESQRNAKDYKRFNKFRKPTEDSNESSEYEDFFEDDM